jgi:hypothetical protein
MECPSEAAHIVCAESSQRIGNLRPARLKALFFPPGGEWGGLHRRPAELLFAVLRRRLEAHKLVDLQHVFRLNNMMRFSLGVRLVCSETVFWTM